MLIALSYSEERDEKLSKHQAAATGASSTGQRGGVATKGTPTAAPLVTVGRDSKAAARGEAISRGAAISRGGAAATNGGLPGDILVSSVV